MIGDIKGYCLLKSSLDCDIIMGTKADWENKICSAMELNDVTQSALLIDSSGTQMGMFEYKHIERMFKCDVVNGVIIPPTKDLMKGFFEASVRQSRKGGYNDIVKRMVIAASLHRQEFNDDFLFEK